MKLSKILLTALGLALLPCHLWAELKGLEIPSRIDDEVWHRLKNSVLMPPKTEISVKNGYGNINATQRHVLWKNLANTALVWKRSGDIKIKDLLRRNLMALCTFESWFDDDKEFKNTESARVALQIVFAMHWSEEALAAVELERVHQRLGQQLQKYLALARGDKSSPWWGIVSHPDHLPHMAAMAGIAKTIKSSNRLLASEALSECQRHIGRYQTLMDQRDGSALCLSLDRDLEQQFYLLLIDLLDDGKISPRWAQRYELLEFMVLPGQEGLVDWTGQNENRKVHMIPLLRTLGQRLPSPKANRLAHRLFNADRSFTGPWDFLSAIHSVQHAKFDIDHQFKAASYPMSGLFMGRESRRLGAAQLLFRAGPPGGQTAYDAFLLGRPDLDFDHLLPDQGSFWWHHKGRLILGHQMMGNKPKTSDFNTLSIGLHGQVFEGYPRYSQRHWQKPAGGYIFLDQVHGHSWILGAQLKGCYPSEVGLESWIRLLLWVGPGILIQVDEVTLDSPQEMNFHYNSPQLPLSPKEDGFYQRISGMRMVSKSFPKGKWNIEQRDAVGQKTSFVATESLVTREWSRVNLMGPESMVSDAWVERLNAGTGLDFQRKNIRFAYRLDGAGLETSLFVRDKEFFNISLSSEQLNSKAQR